MVFSSSVFLFLFMPAAYLAAYIVPGIKAKNHILLIFSLLFYAWGEPLCCVVLAVSCLINYLLAGAVQKRDGQSSALRRFVLIVAVFYNLGLLVLFKYIVFIVESVNSLGFVDLAVPDIAMPIGISFFTFQALSYIVDVYRGQTPAAKKPIEVMLYISLFPQLIAGPIVKYHDVAEQINKRELTPEKAARGIRRFCFGLAKKVLIADIAAVAADAVFSSVQSERSAPFAWLGAAAYCIQIYFDFSGYSDMAIGLAGMAGFELKENFDYPYTAQSIKEFWRRWHISLSTWFKEYVYIPLGGNRKGKVTAAFNKLAVFLLCGLWHGAQWTFVAWGLLHGLFLSLESFGVIKPEKWRFRPLRHIYTLLVVCLGFVLFRAESFGAAFDMYTAMFTGFTVSPEGLSALLTLLTPKAVLCLCAGVLFSAPALRSLWSPERLKKGRKAASAAGYALAVVLYVLCAATVATSAYSPFIYFRF